MRKRKKHPIDAIRTVAFAGLREAHSIENVVSMARDYVNLQIELAQVRGELRGIREGLGIRERGFAVTLNACAPAEPK